MPAFIERQEADEAHPDTPYPTIYRVPEEHFSAPYQDRFQEGEFRKRVQFMYGGELRTVQFQYSGLSIEAVLDRLPTAKVLEEREALGMWRFAAYVLSDECTVAENIAQMYRSLTQGDASYIEKAAVNVWDNVDGKNTDKMKRITKYGKQNPVMVGGHSHKTSTSDFHGVII